MSTMPPPPVLFVPPKLPEGLGITDWPVLSGIEEDFIFELKEYCNLKTSLINKEEQELKERDIRLAVDRVLHLKRLKAMKAQDSSEWSNYPLMHGGRYQLLNMIGKGGFSEVYKGFDVDSLQNVAIKIHQIKKDMGAQERINYVRHALRETEIQRKLKHPRIVSLKDRFPIDNNCFASVLEYQEGNDLDSHLKANGPLGEKEARGIITQIFSALKYLNSDGIRVIHYDLKPGNVLYHRCEAKITDFGLSKMLSSESHDSIELTSPGAGTYWYLPPECFQFDRAQKISNKVDVWSAGVILYEMLFSRRPFAHGVSQESIIQSGAISNARQVEFPLTPKVSNECMDFIKKLLAYNVDTRCDVHEAYSHTYLRHNKKG
eukprot:GHVL01020454.1.p1 GENE.GHVL01020454.1~~GHVL01020454.1.p1  ORF type:complete len:375 (-),score=47.50 GHVL01020454.1:377-1501(-)